MQSYTLGMSSCRQTEHPSVQKSLLTLILRFLLLYIKKLVVPIAYIKYMCEFLAMAFRLPLGNLLQSSSFCNPTRLCFSQSTFLL